jgi:hypothetical protein
MIGIVSAAGPHTLLYVCLPDTVDPRGPKGGKRCIDAVYV